MTSRTGTTNVKKRPNGVAYFPLKISRGWHINIVNNHHNSIRLWLRTNQSDVEHSISKKLYASATADTDSSRNSTSRIGSKGHCSRHSARPISAMPRKMFGTVAQSMRRQVT